MEVVNSELTLLEPFFDLYDADEDVILAWGGRDTGKSHNIAKILVSKCLNNDYFRCILVKKTYESIKDAQWQEIKDIVHNAGLEPAFRFSQSPLEIECLLNGNKFIARGCDRPEKLKSISNPSHAWFEEGNHLTQEDYETISTTLRSPYSKVQEWFSFNPEVKNGTYQDFWLYKMYFEGENDKSFISDKVVKVGEDDFIISVRSVHGTYHQNPYCTPERIARHEMLKKTNPYRYKVFTLGEWGNEENTNPFFYAYNHRKHYKDRPYQIDNRFELVFSFDFNADPCTCVVGQWNRSDKTFNIIGSHYASPSHRSALENLCEDLKRIYFPKISRHLITVTGDAAGKHSDADRPLKANRYTQIMNYLGIGNQQVKVESANIKHSLSRDLCNDVLNEIPEGYFVFWNGTEKLIENIQASYPDSNESLDKAKKELGLHDVDGWRYLMKYWFAFGKNGQKFREYQNFLTSYVRGIN